MEKKFPTGLKITFLVHGVAMTFFAFTYLFIPVLWGDLTGCFSNQVPQIYRLWGLTIFGYAITSFLAYREKEWESVKIVALMERIISVLFAILLLIALLFWDLPAIGWKPFVVMTGFGIAFNLFYPRE